MSRSTYIVNVEPPELRIAELQDGRLFALDIDRGGRLLGDIFKGRIENVLPGMDAAFINIGLQRNALIYAGDIGLSANPIDKPIEQPIEKLVRVGDELIVQVARPPVGTKGARVTTRLSLPGRFVVLVANSDTVGVSRRLDNEDERLRLRRIAEKLRPLDHGIIVRTEGEGISEAEIAADVGSLTRQIHAIRQRAAQAKPPTMLHKDLGLLGRLTRDRLSHDTEAVIIDSLEVAQTLRELMANVLPELVDRIKVHDSTTPIFKAYNLDAEIERATDRTVSLKHGGEIVVDETEALTAIDVNTGRFIGKNRLAETVFQTNMEAVEEAARQLRLRDLGGVIVIDFIDMERTRDRIKVLNSLEAALKQDRARTRIVQISPSGLVEMTRRREGSSLRNILHRPCPYCSGEGVIKSPTTVALQARRQIRELAAQNHPTAIQVTMHPETASAFLGNDDDTVHELEQMTKSQLHVLVEFGLHLEASRIITGEPREFDHDIANLTLGERVQMASGLALYPQKEPHFTVLQNKLVLLENIHDLKLDEAAPAPAMLIEILEVGRWYHRARIVPVNESTPK
jgi:ribonuclease G